MPTSISRFIKRCAELQPKSEIKNVPRNTRGIYILYSNTSKNKYDAIYIGMARGVKTGIHSRLNSHARSKKKSSAWSHFSIFEVHDNITNVEIEELEGLLRHIYRYDFKANPFNQHRGFHKLKKLNKIPLVKWK